MSIIRKEEFVKKGTEVLGKIYDQFQSLPDLKLDSLPYNHTALIIVDMVNGFAKEGALMSPRVHALIKPITELQKQCIRLGIRVLAFADSHTMASPEFDSFPQHCLLNTYESEIIAEIKDAGKYDLIAKNSTNGFIEPQFQLWLKENFHINNYIVVGDCTDICVMQFANTLKTWFNMHDKISRVIVPANLVDTYDLGLHNAQLMNLMGLLFMQNNGVEIVSEVL